MEGKEGNGGGGGGKAGGRSGRGANKSPSPHDKCVSVSSTINLQAIVEGEKKRRQLTFLLSTITSDTECHVYASFSGFFPPCFSETPSTLAPLV